jgi:hypothetical protein
MLLIFFYSFVFFNSLFFKFIIIIIIIIIFFFITLHSLLTWFSVHSFHLLKNSYSSFPTFISFLPSAFVFLLCWRLNPSGTWGWVVRWVVPPATQQHIPRDITPLWEPEISLPFLPFTLCIPYSFLSTSPSALILPPTSLPLFLLNHIMHYFVILSNHFTSNGWSLPQFQRYNTNPLLYAKAGLWLPTFPLNDTVK